MVYRFPRVLNARRKAFALIPASGCGGFVGDAVAPHLGGDAADNDGGNAQRHRHRDEFAARLHSCLHRPHRKI